MLRSLLNYLKSFIYCINDPSTPDLKTTVEIPQQETLKYTVKGFEKEDIKSINCYVNLGVSIRYFQKIAENKLSKWAVVQNLNVNPLAGRDLNAYYDRLNLKFFYAKPSNQSKIIYTVDSADIVSHELGHAILDAMRPDIWSLQSLEVWSFHEAFADIFAAATIMQYDVILNKVLEETNENLNKSNHISRLAEELGSVIHGKSLRDLSIKFYYQDPSKLPREGTEDQLYAECHSFGKVFASAWYQIFVDIFKYYKLNNKNSLKCLEDARDCAFSLFINSIKDIPKTNKFYEAAACCMLQKSKKNKDIYEIVKKVFIEWNLIKDVKILSNNINLDKLIRVSKADRSYKPFLNNNNIVVWKKIDSFVNLNYLKSMDKSQNFKVQCALDSYYLFDENKNLINSFETNLKESTADAYNCVENILKNDNLGINKMWILKKNKLVRNFIV